ncbi:MAG: DegT/DnrJ/EryC1/StrS aminotransferase family protein [Methanomicrobiales archaeon]|nr:DegT/DnrJ/EryC1/StrS aminotransferase family protein [Methanomicrobiales archaeon]
MIPLARPTITADDTRAVQAVLESGNIATGSVVKEFEEKSARYIGRNHAIAVNSGTIALYLAVRVPGFRKVVLPAITCPEVLNAVVHAGAEPLVVDVDEETHNLDPRELRGDRAAGADAVVITHAYGHPARIDEIREACQSRGLTLIEDFAQSTGATYRGGRCGSFGAVSATSFYATKSLTTGHGGMVLTDSDDLGRKLRIARGDEAYEYLDSFVPLNLKITDFQAAMGIRQLERLDGFLEKRRRIAALYRAQLADMAGITLLHEQEGAMSCYYKFVIMLDSIRKETFISGMRGKGVQAGVLYDPPLHRMKIMKARYGAARRLPVAERIAEQAVSLPIFPSMSDSDVRKVCRAIGELMA